MPWACASRGAGAILIGLIVVRGLLGLTNAPLHPASARMVFDQVPRPIKRLCKWTGDVLGLPGNSRVLPFDGIADRLFGWPNAFLMSGGLTLMVASVWTVLTRAFGKPFGTEADPSIREI